MSNQQAMTNLQQTSTFQVEVDPILLFMKIWGIPLTRIAYLDVLGLTEPLNSEIEQKIPKVLI